MQEKVLSLTFKQGVDRLLPTGLWFASAKIFTLGCLWADFAQRLKVAGDHAAADAAITTGVANFVIAGLVAYPTMVTSLDLNFDGELAGKKAAQFVNKISGVMQNAISRFEQFVDNTSQRPADNPGDDYWPYAKPGKTGFE